jgi:hypothetical protein
MRRNELSCPICSADVPLSGDEKPGEEVFCTFCGAPSVLAGDLDSDDCELKEED